MPVKCNRTRGAVVAKLPIVPYGRVLPILPPRTAGRRTIANSGDENRACFRAFARRRSATGPPSHLISIRRRENSSQALADRESIGRRAARARTRCDRNSRRRELGVERTLQSRVMSKTLRVALVGLLLCARSTSAGEPYPNETIAPVGGDRFLRLMSDQPPPASGYNSFVVGSQATANGVAPGMMPVAPGANAPIMPVPQAPPNVGPVAAPIAMPGSGYPGVTPAVGVPQAPFQVPSAVPVSVAATIGQTAAAQPPLFTNTVGTTPVVAPQAMPLWNPNIQLTAQQSGAGQQPSVVYVQPSGPPAPPAPPRSAEAGHDRKRPVDQRRRHRTGN